jgi:L-ornithine N5-oxygenase
MKDLATLRNPGSPYTFLSYLHSEGRLLSFINRGGTVPTRKEYSDYLTWASKKVQENGINVKFGHEIVDLEEGTEDTILVRYKNNRTGEETVVRARKSSRIHERVNDLTVHGQATW